MGSVKQLCGKWLDAQRRAIALGDKTANVLGTLDEISKAMGPLLEQWLKTHSLYLTRFVGVDTIVGILKSSPSIPVDEKLIALEQKIDAGQKLAEEKDAELARLTSVPNRTRSVENQIQTLSDFIDRLNKDLIDMKILHREVLMAQGKPFSAFSQYILSNLVLRPLDTICIWLALGSGAAVVFECTRDDLQNRSEVIARLTDGGRGILAIVLKTHMVIHGNETEMFQFYTVTPLLTSVLETITVPPSKTIGEQIWKLPNENLNPDWWAILTQLTFSVIDNPDVEPDYTVHTSDGQSIEIAVEVPEKKRDMLPQHLRSVVIFNKWGIVTRAGTGAEYLPVSQWIQTTQKIKCLLVEIGLTASEQKSVYTYPFVVTDEKKLGRFDQIDIKQRFSQIWQKPLANAIALAGIQLKEDMYLLWTLVEVTSSSKGVYEAMPIVITYKTNHAKFAVKPPYWSGESTFPCVEVRINRMEIEENELTESLFKNLNPFKNIIQKHILNTSPRTGTIGHIEFISAEGGCNKMVLTKGAGVGSTFVNLAKSIGSLYDVDWMTLTDAATVKCGKSPWFAKESGRDISLALVNTLKEGIPWYSRFGFIPKTKISEGIRFVQQVLSAKPWHEVREAFAQVASTYTSKRGDREKHWANERITALYAVDALNCCAEREQKTGLVAAQLFLYAAQSNICSMVGPIMGILDTPELAAQFLRILKIDPATFDLTGVVKFMTTGGSTMIWFRRPPPPPPQQQSGPPQPQPAPPQQQPGPAAMRKGGHHQLSNSIHT